MATSKTREKRRQARLKKRETLQELDPLDRLEKVKITPDPEVEELDVDPDDVEVVGELEKDYYDGGYVGPTSWIESDAMEVARQQAMEVRQVTYTAEDLVRNIIYRPDMSPDDKGKAIAAVGEGYGKRVKSITNQKIEKEVSIESIYLHTLNAVEARNLSVTDKIGTWFAKSFTNQDDLPDESFALVEDTVRKYPIHNKNATRQSLILLEKEYSEDNAHAKRAYNAVVKAANEFEIGRQASNSVIIQKDHSGNWRVVLWASNNFSDRDGEIISKEAHEEYVEWFNKNKDCPPVFMTWHIPGTRRENPIDFVGFEKGFLIMSAPLTEKEAGQLLKMQANIDMGLSVGGSTLERSSTERNVITKYRIFEVSDLPLSKAANPFTDFEVLKKEYDMESQTNLQYLTGILGDEALAKKYLEKAEIKQDALRKEGVTEKAAQTDASTEKEVETPSAPAIPNLEEVVKALSKEFGMEQLSETIATLQENSAKMPVLEGLVKELILENQELKKGSDEKLAELISPIAGKGFAWMHENRASQKKESVLRKGDEKDEKLEKSQPVHWLSQATNTQPVEAG